MTTSATQTTGTPPVPALTVTSRQRDPSVFAGVGADDVSDWIDSFERASRHNRWDDHLKLSNVIFYLTNVAHTWFINHELEFDTWTTFKTRMLEVFGKSAARKHVAERKLALRVQQKGETYTSYIEDVLSLIKLADKDMQERDKLQHLLKGIDEEAFRVLLVIKPSTLTQFSDECLRLQEAKTRRVTSPFPEVTSNDAHSIAALTSTNAESLRNLIREIVREEIASITASSQAKPTESSSLKQMIQAEVVAAMQPLPPPRPTYAEVAARAPVQSPWHNQGLAPFSPTPSQFVPEWGHHRPAAFANNRPVCYYCGIPGHVQRNCRRRRQEQAPSDHFSSSHWAPRRTFHSRPELRSPSPGLDERPQPNTSRPTTRRSPSPRGRSLSPMIPAHNGETRRSGGNW